jgi:hypothetical protein
VLLFPRPQRALLPWQLRQPMDGQGAAPDRDQTHRDVSE